MDETVACGLTPDERHVKWDILETWHLLASDSVLLMQQICSSCADHVQFTCWGSLTVPAVGQAGAGTHRCSAVEGESNPILAWHDHKAPRKCCGLPGSHGQSPGHMYLVALGNLKIAGSD